MQIIASEEQLVRLLEDHEKNVITVKEEQSDVETCEDMDPLYQSDDAYVQHKSEKKSTLAEVKPVENISLPVSQKTKQKPIRPETEFKCRICDTKYESLEKLEVHRKGHDWLYGCKVCLLEFNTQEELEEHGKTHTVSSRYACKFCNKPFALRRNMRLHWRVSIVAIIIPNLFVVF